MIALKDILYKVTINAVAGSTGVNITAIDFDSRNIKSGYVFLAVKVYFCLSSSFRKGDDKHCLIFFM